MKLISIYECPIPYVKYMFCKPGFHMWNFEPVHLTCDLGISYVKRFLFNTWNENFICENIPIPYVFHWWNDVKFS